MSKSVMLSMLAECDNGSELMSILDYLSSDNVAEVADIESPMIGIPTLEEIAF